MGLVEGASRSRLRFDPEIMRAVAGCAFIQENGPERVDVKRDLLAKISAAVPSDSLIATSAATEAYRGAGHHRFPGRSCGENNMKSEDSTDAAVAAVDREVTETYSEIHSSSDRACAIISAAFIEDRLQRAICRRLLDDDRTVKKITSPNGALSGFENKILLGYLLGVYNKETRDNLLVVGQIRNKFAHYTKIRSFDNPNFRQFFDRLTIIRRIEAKDSPLEFMAVDAIFPHSSRRDIFLHVIHRVLGYFAFDDWGREQQTFNPLF